MRSISGRKCVIDSDVTEMGSPQGPRDGVRSRAVGEFDVVEEKEKWRVVRRVETEDILS